jgi:hypothetical protein
MTTQGFRRSMKHRKKTTIVTFESRERTTIRRAVQPRVAWCSECSDDVLMVTPGEAASLNGIDTRTIFRAIESGQIHFREDLTGGLLVCSKSVSFFCSEGEINSSGQPIPGRN